MNGPDPPQAAPDPEWIDHGPRVAPGSRRELGLRIGSLLAVIRLATRGRSVNVFATVGRNRRIAFGWLYFAARLMPFGTLPRADTELVILRVAYNCRSRYEWIQHRALARRAGLDADALERVKLGGEAAGWTPRQRAMLLAVDELHRDRVIGEETWHTLEQHLDVPALIELCALVGHYEMTAMTLNSLGVQVEAPALALERRAGEGR